MKINQKRLKFENKSSQLKVHIYQKCTELGLTDFDLECVLSEMLYQSINSKLKNKYGRGFISNES